MKSSRNGLAKSLIRFGIFAAIPLAIFTIVLLIPFFRGIFLTFTNWDGFDFDSFVGFDNYALAVESDTFWSAMTMTFAYVLASLVLVNLVGFGLALLVTVPLRSANIFRTFFFVPNLIGGVILGLIWQFIFGEALTSISGNLGLPIFSDNWLLTGMTLAAIVSALALMIALTWTVIRLGDWWGSRRSGLMPAR